MARSLKGVRPSLVPQRIPEQLLTPTMANAVSLKWQFFFGACALTGAALLPHAGVRPVAAGMALAGVIRWLWHVISRRHQ